MKDPSFSVYVKENEGDISKVSFNREENMKNLSPSFSRKNIYSSNDNVLIFFNASKDFDSDTNSSSSYILKKNGMIIETEVENTTSIRKYYNIND